MKTILTVDNLSKHYGRLKAVDQVSFTIEKGKVYGVLGPNGSGKSTMLGVFLNVVNKTSGTFQWFGGEISHAEALKRVGAIIERPNFYPYMSAYQNLQLVCKIKGIPYHKIEEKLELVGLLERKDSKFSTFSLGMKQRLAIASALLNDPEILILDEPTNGLDPQGIQQIREIIKLIASKGTTIMLASHLLDEVEKVCTHIILLKFGKMLYSGPVQGLTNAQIYFEVQAEGADNLELVLKEMPGVIAVEKNEDRYHIQAEEQLDAKAINRYMFDHGVVLSHLRKCSVNLEEQFLRITKNS